ncbi:MAG: HDOD domain-containing protein [Deltaproteobacteria bacterium]|nr:HDOD domain-containing protein [Deltaproteobacteria bacterium]
MPEVALKLMDVVDDPSSCAGDVAKIVIEDPAVTSRVLRIVNSAFYGRGIGRSPITSIPYAVARLGMREIKNIVFSLGVFDMFDQQDSAINLRNFWKHSVSVAISTRVVNSFAQDATGCTDEDLDADYVAGLLHELGLMVVSRYFPEIAHRLVEQLVRDRTAITTAEHSLYDGDHAEFGAYLTERWNFPRRITQAIRHHHAPAEAPEEFRRSAYVVMLADYLCNLHWPEQSLEGVEYEAAESMEAFRLLNIPYRVMSDMIEMIEEDAARSEIFISLR